MPKAILIEQPLTVNGSTCKKVTISSHPNMPGFVEIDLLLAHGKYTTIEISPEDLAKVMTAASEAVGGAGGGPNILAE